MSVCLHDAIGQQHHGVEDHANAENCHQPGAENQILAGVFAKQRHDRLRHDKQPYGTGHGNQGGDPGSGFLGLPDGLILFQRKLGGDRGNGADGNGGDKGAGQIENGLGHIVNALHAVRLILGKADGEKPTHVHLDFQCGQKLQARGTQSDGDGDGKQFFYGCGDGFRLPHILGKLPEGGTEHGEQV